MHARHTLKWLQRLAVCLGLAMACGQVLADNDAWYQIEVIVYANKDTSSAADETWPDDPGFPDMSKALDLAAPAVPGATTAMPMGYVAAEAKSFQLMDVEGSLRRSSRYEPILHVAWRQLMSDKRQASPIRIHGGKQYTQPVAVAPPAPAQSEAAPASASEAPDAVAPSGADAASGSAAPAAVQTIPQVDGTITVTRSRYLHAWVDLVYAKPTDGEAGSQTVARFRMQQHRRMRSGELHYFDHPMFGVLIRITPYKPPAPAAQPAASTDAPAH